MEAIRETVLLLYQATAESLHQALRARAEGEAGTAAEAHSHRPGSTSWTSWCMRSARGRGRSAHGSAGPPRTTMLYGALIDAGERLAALSGAAGGRRAGGADSGGRRRGTVAVRACWADSGPIAVPVELDRLGGQRVLPRIRSAAFSAIIITGA